MNTLSLETIDKILKLFKKYFEEDFNQLMNGYGTLKELSQRIYSEQEEILRILSDKFINLSDYTEINNVLSKENYKIEDGVLKEKLPCNINTFVPNKTPEIVKDYITESKESEFNKCFRAAIVLIIAALEANLKLKYFNTEHKHWGGDFAELIKEAKKRKWIVTDKYNNVTIKDIKDRRNYIVHLNFHKKDHVNFITMESAKNSIDTVSYLIKESLVSINS